MGAYTPLVIAEVTLGVESENCIVRSGVRLFMGSRFPFFNVFVMNDSVKLSGTW